MPTDDKPDAILVQHRVTVTFQGTAEDMARWGAASGDGGRNLMSERAGWSDAIAWLEKHLADYVSEHGNYDHSTGVTEFPDGGEYVGSVEELIDGMRLAMPAAPHQTHAAEPVDDLWLVSRDGHGWYRADGKGYTNAFSEAMRYSRDMAYDLSHPFGDNGPTGGLWMHSLRDVLEYRASNYADPLTAQDAALVPEIAALIKAAKSLRADMLERAQMGMDVIDGEQYRIVNAGRTAWADFDAALRAIEGDA